ncbi:MAG TPA: hypothetical protein VJO53_13030 [Candidatus Acidoferrales bacterium]|nr:hypothetical protein [Candidatus Acidoferrales bacterium]
MPSVSSNPAGNLPLRFLAAAAVFLLAPAVFAQSQSPGDSDGGAIPVFSMGTGFVTTFEGGTPHLGPLLSPVILVPVGQSFLIESRDTFESDLAPDQHGRGYKGSLAKEVDYLQLDYIANRYMTVTVGRFLTPFGIFNERLYPVWIRDLHTDPLILPIATGPTDAGTGAMIRGGFDLTPRLEVNYATYFSTLSTLRRLESDRAIGTRAGIYLPGPRVELGGSFQHLLQGDHSNAFGFHFAWQPPPLPLDIRAEYARSHDGSGYWIESAYRLSQSPVWQDVLRHFQLVARMQELLTGAGVNAALPGVNTKMFEFGANYYFRDDCRFVSSYGRQFAPEGNENVWTVGLTYRLALPLWPGADN